MEINLTSSSVLHDQASRETWLTTRVVVEAAFLQGPARDIEVGGVEREVEVGMTPRLLTYERVDAPAAVHPYGDADGLEPVQYLYDVTSSQRRSRPPKADAQVGATPQSRSAWTSIVAAESGSHVVSMRGGACPARGAAPPRFETLTAAVGVSYGSSHSV